MFSNDSIFSDKKFYSPSGIKKKKRVKIWGKRGIVIKGTRKLDFRCNVSSVGLFFM